MRGAKVPAREGSPSFLRRSNRKNKLCSWELGSEWSQHLSLPRRAGAARGKVVSGRGSLGPPLALFGPRENDDLRPGLKLQSRSCGGGQDGPMAPPERRQNWLLLCSPTGG